MTRQPHHTTPQLSEQLACLVQEEWQEVLKRLPADYEAQAGRLKAFVRKREVACAGDLLRALLAYVLSVSSLRQLGCWAVLIGLCNISEAAWRKRLRKASLWLLWLLGELLAGPVVPAQAVGLPGQTRVLLVDATRLKQPGGTGDDWRLHTAYDLLSARLMQVSLSDQHGAESLERFVVQAGDVVVADAGYGYRRCVVWVLHQQAQVVVRIHPSAFPLLDETGAPLDVVAWLRHVQSGQHSRTVRFVWAEQSYQVRLVVCSLSPEAAEKARQAKRKKAAKMQRQPKEDTIFLAGWILLITSLSASTCSDEQVLALYRARWQTELLYKRMKQVLRLSQLRSHRPETNQATLLALLVAWALQEQEAQQARSVLEQAAACLQPTPQALPAPASVSPSAACSDKPPISSWLLTSVCVQTLRQITQGHWTLSRLSLCLPHLQRFFRGSPRKRRQQESLMRTLLTHLLVSDLPLDEAFFSCSSA